MKPMSEELSTALEDLRNRPIVTESRDYARQWEQVQARRDLRRGLLFGATGVIAAACMTAFVVFGLLPRLAETSAENVLESEVGETRTVALDDGSRVVLDTRSRLRIAFTTDSRNVELLEGQAHFEVAKDPYRPFRVRTPFAEVVAVGTTFDVSAVSALTTVTLIEGSVYVRTVSGVPQGEPRIEALVPGQQLGITSDGKLLGKKVVKIASVTAWQRGTIVIDDMPLAEALAALNRYSTTQIVITDQRLQSRRISGVFRIGDVETEAIALQRYFNLREKERSAREIVLERN